MHSMRRTNETQNPPSDIRPEAKVGTEANTRQFLKVTGSERRDGLRDAQL